MHKRLMVAIAALTVALAIAGSFHNSTTVHGISYAIAATGDLYWYRHDGRADGSNRWADNNGRKVGSGWNFKQVFSSGDGVIYAVADNGDLYWYRHDGREDGSTTWADNNGRKVGSGWIFRQVFSGGEGVIYAVAANGDLYWYRHDGREDGSTRWADNNGRKVGSGWNFKQVFSGDDGVIYAVTDSAGTSGGQQGGSLEPPHSEKLPPPEDPRCQAYASRAVDQFNLMLRFPQCRVNRDARWNADYKGHYNWCLTAPQAARTNEQKIRDDHLYRCGAQKTFD